MATPPTTYLEMMMQTKAQWTRCLEKIQQSTPLFMQLYEQPYQQEYIMPTSNDAFEDVKQLHNMVKHISTSYRSELNVPNGTVIQKENITLRKVCDEWYEVLPTAPKEVPENAGWFNTDNGHFYKRERVQWVDTGINCPRDIDTHEETPEDAYERAMKGI